MTNRAHLLKTLVSSTGAVLTNCSVAVYAPGTTTLLVDDIYVDNSSGTTLPNPFTSANGVLSIYLNSSQRVRIGVTAPDAGEVFFDDLDVLEPIGADLPAADATGFTVDTTTYDNPVSGTGKIATAVFPSNDSTAFAVAVTGDAFPRVVIATDGTTGVYLGDGTVDPTVSGANLYAQTNGDGTFASTLFANATAFKVGVPDANIGHKASSEEPLTIEGITIQAGNGTPYATHKGGNVGDLYLDRSSTSDVVWLCTAAGTSGSVTWNLLYPLPRQSWVQLGSPTANSIFTGLIQYSGQRLYVPSSSASTLTIQPGFAAAGGGAVWYDIHQAGTGAITVVAGSGVTLHSRGNRVVSNGKDAVFTIRHIGNDDWLLTGDLV